MLLYILLILHYSQSELGILSSPWGLSTGVVRNVVIRNPCRHRILSFSRPTMQTTITLSDGSVVPWLAWGNGSGRARKDPVNAGKLALSCGIRHLDTAQGYNNEKESGECITAAGLKPSDLYVTSKSAYLSTILTEATDLI